jgi:hypothetical protein
LPAATAIKEALAQLEQDMPKIGCVNHDCAKCKAQQQSRYCLNCEELSKQVTALKICLEVERGFREQEQPAQRTWVGLTDDQIKEIHHLSFGKDIAIATGLTEAKLKENNT